MKTFLPEFSSRGRHNYPGPATSWHTYHHTNTVLYCNVLFCTVLFCTVLYCHILTHISPLQPEAVQRCCHLSCFTSSHWPLVHQNPSRWPEIEVTGDAVRQLMRCNVELQTDFDHHWLVKILYGLEDIYLYPAPRLVFCCMLITNFR